MRRGWERRDRKVIGNCKGGKGRRREKKGEEGRRSMGGKGRAEEVYGRLLQFLDPSLTITFLSE